MDAVSALLTGPRAQGAFLLRSSMDPPWCLRIEDGAPLTVAAVVRGEAHVSVDGDEAAEAAEAAEAEEAAEAAEGGTWLAAGDVMLCRGPTPYVVADHPDTAPQVVIGPGQVCTTVDGSDAFGELEQSVRSWGNAADGATLLVTGTYEHASQVSLRLLSALPVLSVIRRDEWENPVLDLLVAEVVKDAPGQPAILDRLLDLLCLTTVRACFTRPGATPPPWYTAAADPTVGPALELIHNNPAHPWSVASLGAAVGASRASFARRFTDLVGEPPLTYLTKWRLDLAADELHDPSATVARIARSVGYENPFAFSNAFKRHTGLSPSEHRRVSREQPALASH